MDGNEAAAYASYAFTEVAAIYPITPSSPMAEYVDEWAANGKKNIFGETVKLVEMQSEAGAISAVHGAMEVGALTSTYTASQGLLLMVPTMYRIAGSLKPSVIHVAARSVALHGYSINAEHSDVMACRQTGYAMLASASVQEAMDLGAVAHLASIKSSVPFLHFFDGFRTSHEIQKIDCLDYEDLAKIVDYDAIERFRKMSLNPEYPIIKSTGQTPDTYFQSREACSEYYEPVADVVEKYMNNINQISGRNYKPFNYFGRADATEILIAMGSVSGTAQGTVDYLNQRGRKVGFINVHLYRPWSMKHFIQAVPKTVKVITVLDRTKENGALGDPLFEDVVTAIAEMNFNVTVLAGRYGIGGKDTTPAQIVAVFDNAISEKPLNHFTLGIKDDVLNRSLVVGEKIVPKNAAYGCLFWGLGSDGTVGANKNTIKIIGDYTEKYIQAYFEYDGKKSGGLTKSHLRFGDQPIQSSYYVSDAEFVACHNQTFMYKYDMWSDLKDNGSFLLNTNWSQEELALHLPVDFKKYVVEHNINLYTIDATAIAKEIGLGNRTNTILQAAFFKITEILPIEQAVQYMKSFALKSYGMKGEDIVQKNYAAIHKGIELLKKCDIPKEWADGTGWKPDEISKLLPDYVKKILIPVAARKGNQIPVSAFKSMADGRMPVGTSKYELRGIAVDVPCWNPDECIGCNRCSYVCPNAAIRPFLTRMEDIDKLPFTAKHKKAIGKDLADYIFTIQVDPIDCVGCGSCVNVCPKKNEALKMEVLDTQTHEQDNWNYFVNQPEINPVQPTNVKNSQFAKPLLEFPGCCAGCGETPYVKLATQLFGERMIIATATGCSAVWATDYPIGPYTTNSKGRGPAMSNSLFENNGEYGFGMRLGNKMLRNYMKKEAEMLMHISDDNALKEAANSWLSSFDDGAATVKASEAFIEILENTKEEKSAKHIEFLLKNKEHMIKKSTWIIGGDGWAYDIGYGGLDHILAAGEDVNILVLDTEVYSNTGGQASKATQKGAVAQFAAAGRKTSKKDLGMMAMAYENVYVASIAMGANYEQCLKVLKEAESYNGTSIIIAYAPCINHGLKAGMGNSMNEMKKAVQCGYWFLYRYDPRKIKNGENPFVLDSDEPKGEFAEFLKGEVRFASLQKKFPDEAQRLNKEAEAEAKKRYRKYLQLAKKEM